jgi:DNA (cytosine-5)-methyltransferase 1
LPTPVAKDASGHRNSTANRTNPNSPPSQREHANGRDHHVADSACYGPWFNSEGHQSTLPGTVRELLPTPRSSDCFGAGLHGDGGMDLRTTVTLLQTPSTADGDGGHLNRSGSRKGEPLLPGQAREMATSWGKYAPAITRWEQVTRPAPSPTEPNTKGNPRLSAAFSEWLMGWPAGWVTGVPGISRNAALRIIGNGVCPQQATAGLRWLLSVCEAAA